MGLNELLAALVVGIASSLAAHRIVTLKWGRAFAVGLVLAATAAVLVSLVAPYKISSVVWCLQGPDKVHIEGHLSAILLARSPADVSVQVKIYEPGRGDPPMAGPAYAKADAAGRFSASFSRVADLPGYLINVAYPFDTLLGER
jgi:hypothetical protein